MSSKGLVHHFGYFFPGNFRGDMTLGAIPSGASIATSDCHLAGVVSVVVLFDKARCVCEGVPKRPPIAAVFLSGCENNGNGSTIAPKAGMHFRVRVIVTAFSLHWMSSAPLTHCC